MRNAIGCLLGSLLTVLACSGSNDGDSNGATGGTSSASNGGNVSNGGAGTRTTSGGYGGDNLNTGGVPTGGRIGSNLGGGAGVTSSIVQGGQATTGGAASGAAGTATGARAGQSTSAGSKATGGSAQAGSSSATGGSGRGGANTGGSSSKGGAAGSAGSSSRGGAGSGGQTGRGGTATGGTSAASGSGNTAGGPVGSCGESPGQLFGKDHPWNQRIDQAALDSESATIIAYLQQNHTASARFRVDGPSDEPNNQYGITVLTADASTAHQKFTPSGDFYEPDCDPAPVPVPATGAIEGESSYACTNDGDCHLIVIDRAECRLYEMWRANRTSATAFDGGCLAVWDLRQTYQPLLRGDCCTSADAAGLPIAAHMFSADEIAAGRIEHAIRFILPNSLIRQRIYVRPATHATATTGSAAAPPYGVRMRLKSTFSDSALKPAARVVARALKEYGMILSDGGNITFTATNDRFTTHKWAEVDFTASDLTSLKWSDFEVPELGPRYTFNNACNCDRTPITQ